MGRKFRGALAGILGVSMLLGSLGAAQAQSSGSDYSGHWAQKTIESWLEKGNLKGFQDGSVKPNQTITRAEFMTLVNRSFGFTAEADVNFSDVNSASWSYSEVAKAVAAGYIQGYNNEIRPNAPINRQEAAVVVGKLLQLTEGDINDLQVFSDAGTIAPWSKASVAAAVKAGILKGYPDGTFAPQQALTRAESLTLIDSAAAQMAVSQPTTAPAAPASASPSASPTSSPVPTATAAAVAVGGGGGGGTGGGGAPAPAIPGPTAAPEPTLPVSDVPLLDVHVKASPSYTVTNSVYLEFDYSRVPASTLSAGKYAAYYVTRTPITSEDLEWELNNKRYITLLPALFYASKPYDKVIVPKKIVETAGDYYVTVIIKGDSQPIGYYSQKINLQPSDSGVSGEFVKLESGVSIKQEKQEFDTYSNGGTHYSDVVDVTYANKQLNGKAVYYSVSPKYTASINTNRTLNELLSASLYLYTSQKIRYVGSGYPVYEPMDEIPLARERYQTEKFYNEQNYTVIFYDKDLQAIGYYEGEVQLSDELAVEAAEIRIDQIGSGLALSQENTIMRAARAFSRLNDDLKAQISQYRQSTLDNALDQLEMEQSSGPLGNTLPLVSSRIFTSYMTLNGAILTAYSEDLNTQAQSISFYITENPITNSDLVVPSTYGRQPYSSLVELPVPDLQGDYYVTIVLYDENNQPIRYATQPQKLTKVVPVWDKNAEKIENEIILERDYKDGSRIDYAIFQDYVRTHPEAKYVTAISRSEIGERSFTVEHALQQTRPYYHSSNQHLQLSYQPDLNLAGLTEDYIVIFYDKDLKVVSYYIGSLAG
ncbi:hypothetical protein C2I18_13635 [Paenibacillus sp. PK3_47]|uniref:S-layer homology domain-containing protein n=1 Tax=Paenibacillus sp. PK3_47 TaxID=2072642 RepID=UPI00201DF9D9|nr:S-layer homology domain-containing protein [Paenibacillus sp. PK3_47]UQZ34467.1 hypothetical protein C2I18_13635 [Paenibacillus sp. PK3_47]